MSETQIAFASEGATLDGLLLTGDAGGARPAIVMSHGFTAVADQLLPQARAFAAAGFAVLLFDNYGFGRSGGEPRQEVDPVRQVRGIHDAVSFARSRPEVDPARIGLWGSSLSGGNALLATALDPRVGCVVAQVPFIAGWDLVAGREDGAELLAGMFVEREARQRGAAPTLVPVTSGDSAPCILRGPTAHAYFTKAEPLWRNAVTLGSMELLRAYEPGWWIERVAPRPLLMIVADDDRVTPTDHALAAFERAGEPKRKLLVEGGHFAPYMKHFDACVGAAIDWFREHLGQP